MKRNLLIGSMLATLFASLTIAQFLLERRVDAQAKGATQAPRFEVDPTWPKPLPNGWYLGQTIGVGVDANDHVWIIHRAGSLEAGEVHATTNPPIAQCCAPAPRPAACPRPAAPPAAAPAGGVPTPLPPIQTFPL